MTTIRPIKLIEAIEHTDVVIDFVDIEYIHSTGQPGIPFEVALADETYVRFDMGVELEFGDLGSITVKDIEGNDHDVQMFMQVPVSRGMLTTLLDSPQTKEIHRKAQEILDALERAAKEGDEQ